jgi:choline dehydrogenase-like flavoprotein
VGGSRFQSEVGENSVVGEMVVEGEEILTDLCIIGAGPAGITIARELHNSGVRVCLLEAGGRNVERRFQRQSRGESDGYPIHRLHASRVRAFGGTLRHPSVTELGWAARPLDPIDFEAREGRPEFGWPFQREHLDPYYARAQSACGVLPFDLAATLWSQQIASDARSVANSTDLEPAIFQFPTADFRDPWKILSASPNVRALLETRAAEIRMDVTGRRVDSIVAVHSGRARVVIRPRLVVLATGGIENARLLLAANDGRGLGNEHDVVGRYFAERLWFHAGHVVLTDKTSVGQLGCFHRLGAAEIAGALRVAESVQRERRLLNVVFHLVPRPAAVTSNAVRSLTTLRKALQRRPLISDTGWHMRNALTGARDVADLAMSRAESRPQVIAVRVQGEQSPNRESRVTLGSRRDDLGIPVARVNWRITEDDHQSIEASTRVLDRVLRSRGLGSVEWTARPESTTLVEGLHHHLGTTRMHVDPREGVVDSECRVHSVENLFVAGSSVFPSCGASNPTLTIVALALRLADKLRAVLNQSSLGDVGGLRS